MNRAAWVLERVLQHKALRGSQPARNLCTRASWRRWCAAARRVAVLALCQRALPTRSSCQGSNARVMG